MVVAKDIDAVLVRTCEESAMSVAELLPALRELNRVDKLRVMQFLVLELAREADGLIDSEAVYPVSSPYDAFEAASVLLQALQTDAPRDA